MCLSSEGHNPGFALLIGEQRSLKAVLSETGWRVSAQGISRVDREYLTDQEFEANRDNLLVPLIKDALKDVIG